MSYNVLTLNPTHSLIHADRLISMPLAKSKKRLLTTQNIGESSICDKILVCGYELIICNVLFVFAGYN